MLELVSPSEKPSFTCWYTAWRKCRVWSVARKQLSEMHSSVNNFKHSIVCNNCFKQWKCQYECMERWTLILPISPGTAVIPWKNEMKFPWNKWFKHFIELFHFCYSSDMSPYTVVNFWSGSKIYVSVFLRPAGIFPKFEFKVLT